MMPNVGRLQDWYGAGFIRSTDKIRDGLGFERMLKTTLVQSLLQEVGFLRSFAGTLTNTKTTP